MLRRLLTVPACFAGALLALAGAPLWFPLAWLLDRLLGTTCRRAGMMLTACLALDSLALLRILGVWLRGLVAGELGSPLDRQRNFDVQRWWTRSLLRAGIRIYQLELDVEGGEAVAPGPLLVLARHSSVADTLLPAVLVADRHGILLRYIAKEELRWEPCLDVLGGRLSSVFIRRGAGAREEIARVGAAVRDLPDREGVLVFPEGTRFDPAKRARVLSSLEKKGDPRLEYARGLRHLLPPRLGGTLRLLEENPGADVLLIRHHGLDGLSKLRDLTRRDLVGRRVRVSFRRFPFQEIPRDPEAREAWLLERWREMDEWVEQASLAAAA